MFKRSLFMLILLCISLPAYAWQLQTRVATVGGQLAVDGGTAQTSVNGTVYKNYTDTVQPAVVITAASGYKITNVYVNGAIVTPIPVSPANYTMGVVVYPTKTTQSILAYFAKETYAMTTAAGVGGSVSPVGTSSVQFGLAKIVSFLPQTGKNVVAIDGLPTGAIVTPAVPAAVNTKVTVTFNMPAEPVNMTGKFVNLTASTDGPKTVLLPGNVTLNAASEPAGATFAWTQTGGPGFDPLSPITGSGAALTFTPAAIGKYYFSVVATSGETTATANAYVVSTDDLVAAANSECNACHVSKGLSSDPFTEWSASLHVTTPNNVTCYDCHVGAGPNGQGETPTGAACIACHSLAAWQGSTHAIEQVSCTSCHNAHSSAAELPACATCHANATQQIQAEWAAGAHGSASGHTTGTCQRCHASEGSIVGANVGWTGSYATLIANQAAIWTPNAPVSTNGISCAACHDPHANGLRAINTYDGTAAVAWDPNQNAAVDQFDVCTSCHTLYDNTGALVGNYHDGGSINVTRTISDSHNDDPATGVGLTTNVVEGYVLRKASASPCADCHNTHMADLAVQEAWATSAHAGKIATKKDAAAKAQSVVWFNTTYPTNAAYPVDSWDDVATIGTSTRTVLEHFQRNAAGIAFYKTTGALDDADGNAWTHYNWDQTSSRGSCQRCHTATGAMNFLNAPASYNAAGTGNDFSHLSGWTASTGSPQQELLFCWGCHSDAGAGTLRNPGAITEVYAAATAGAPAATISYPDLGASNVCMGCHLGREIGDNVKNDTDVDGVRSFINSHYLAAGGMVFNAAGYEFSGQSYDSVGFHKNVGQANAYGTGTAGPCVTCHMSSAEAHSFEVSAASTACGQCHGGLTDAILEESEHEFHLALEELKLAMEAKGIYFYPAHPYFYNAPYVVGGTNTAFTNWAGVYGLASWTTSWARPSTTTSSSMIRAPMPTTASTP